MKHSGYEPLKVQGYLTPLKWEGKTAPVLHTHDGNPRKKGEFIAIITCGSIPVH